MTFTSLPAGPTTTNLFCGAGGDMTGLVEAGFTPILGANHSPRCIETISANYPNVDFLVADINHVDMRRLPATDVLWSSVICTEVSPAGGTRRRKGQLVMELEEHGHVSADQFERTRVCALDVVRATEVHRYKAVIVENVVEFARDWELYEWWLTGMRSLGYRAQIVNASAAHMHGPVNTPAAQWRDRIYIIFTRTDLPKPDFRLRPPAWCSTCEKVVEGVQTWKRQGPRIGKYGQQYFFRCPKRGHGQAEPLVMPSAAILDLDDVGERIGDRARPLAKRTLERIRWGAENLCGPWVATVAGNTYEHGTYRRIWPSQTWPLGARQQTGTDALVVNSNHDDNRTFRADSQPLSTRSTKIGDGLATPGQFVTVLRQHQAAAPTSDPLDTVTSAGRHHWLTTAPYVVKNFGGNARPQHLAKAISEPLGTVTTRDHHALVVPYRRTNRPHLTDQPIGAISTREGHGLAHVTDADLDDFHYRMVKPREHLRAQRFPDDYAITGNKGEQTMQAGNAVAVNAAHWIGERLMQVLGGS